jgi:hypothetical protein
MKEPYFFLRSTWEIFLQKFKINSCLLNDVEFPTKAICYHKKTSTQAACFVLSFIRSCWPLLKDLSCSQDQDYVQATNMWCFYIRSTQNMLFVHPKMLCSYTERRQKICLLGFIKINAQVLANISLKSFLQKRHGLCKSIWKKNGQKGPT